MIFAQSASMCLSIDGQKLLSKSMPCLFPGCIHVAVAKLNLNHNAC